MIKFLKQLGLYIIIVTVSTGLTSLMNGFGFTLTAWDCVASICLWWLIVKDDEE